MVFVDNYCHFTQVGKIKGCWSHLFAWPHNDEELIAFAKSIGLKPGWIQKAGTIEAHFDVVENKRQEALKRGAQGISAREAARWRLNEKKRLYGLGGSPLNI